MIIVIFAIQTGIIQMILKAFLLFIKDILIGNTLDFSHTDCTNLDFNHIDAFH